MSAINELYQELIVDHGRKPRNFGKMTAATHSKDGRNPLCGDKVTIYVAEKNGVIEAVMFEGVGCAISMASASLMTEILKGKTLTQAKIIFEKFHQLMLSRDEDNEAWEDLGKLAALSGVAEFPARVKCATLAWHALVAAINRDAEIVTTEVV